MQVKALCEFIALRALSLVLLLPGECVQPTAQLLSLVAANFICCIGGENRKQCGKKLSLWISSSNQVEMSVCCIKDNERNLG